MFFALTFKFQVKWQPCIKHFLSKNWLKFWIKKTDFRDSFWIKLSLFWNHNQSDWKLITKTLKLTLVILSLLSILIILEKFSKIFYKVCTLISKNFKTPGFLFKIPGFSRYFYNISLIPGFSRFFIPKLSNSRLPGKVATL